MEWGAGGCARCIRAQPHPRCARLQVGPVPQLWRVTGCRGTFLLLFHWGEGAGAALLWEIIGGRETRPHSRPHMAFVNRGIRRNRGSRCGGFLIREGVVVTAAHCNCNLP
uniref:Peptidase S1 domain-containing protein n=1 Tax=Chelonoidis abingdonii TaxID=106734 RepID=A0A8C0GGG2_CHEAB